MNQLSIPVFVETHKSGKPFHESILVNALGGNRFQLVKSPGFLVGYAAGDEITWDEATKKVSLISRGGNICVQCVRGSGMSAVEHFVAPMLLAIGGRVDGAYKDRLLILTVPGSGGFASLERILAAAEREFPGTQWTYSNVYDASDGVTPLDWWK
jgi:hypothetical protein